MKKIYPIVIAAIKDERNRFLLTKRQSPKKEWNKWQFPGGEIEFRESIIDALKREMKEELGVEVIVEKFVPRIFEIKRREDNFHGLLFVYLCQLKDKKQKVILNYEASEYGWFETVKIKKLNGLKGLKEIAKEIEKIIF